MEDSFGDASLEEIRKVLLERLDSAREEYLPSAHERMVRKNARRKNR